MKMFRCDICGKEIGRWYRVSIIPYAMYDEINVSDMVKREYSKDICKDCIEMVETKVKQATNWRRIYGDNCDNYDDE